MTGILLIATRKYKQFVQPLVEQLDRHMTALFEVVLFSDYNIGIKSSSSVKTFIIEPYRFPYATLYRYKIFNSECGYLKKFRYLVYLDVDMEVSGEIGQEFLVDGLFAVRHPGYYASDGWGSDGNPEKSTSWFPADKRIHYYAGGVQGGRADHYLNACSILAENIATDEKNGVMAEWHDETHWNKYCNYERPNLVTELNPSYCMVEQPYLRKSWGIDSLEPKIIALAKDHKTIRE